MLNEAYVKPDVTPQNIVGMVDPIKHVNLITFSEEEAIPYPEKSPRALHITLKCKGFIVAKVLIDGGSTVNVLPKSTLTHLQVDIEDLTPQTMIIRAFDGTQRDTLGEVILPLEIGPSIFHVSFQVMEIDATYTMLLGRPWIHEAGAIPSTLHQKVKYIESGTIISIHGEEDILVSKPVSVPYVDNTEQVGRSLWHSFEVVESNPCQIETPVQYVNQVVARIMTKNGYKEGKGLGLKLQGDCLPIAVPEKANRFGLGYEETPEEKLASINLDKRHEKNKMHQIPHLKETFPAPAEIVMDDQVVHPQYRITINAIEGEEADKPKTIHLSTDKEILKNWEVESMSDVIASK